MMVKICGITNLEDALAAAGAGATALGFNFYPKSPRYIPPGAVAGIAKRLPEGVWKVGVFVNEPPESVSATARLAGLDVVQIHGNESVADYPAGLRVWKAFRVEKDFPMSRLEDCPAEAIVLDGPAGSLYGGSGKTFDWRLAGTLGRKIIIAGGLDAGNVRQAIALARPWGVDACSGLESEPGRKDHDKVRSFLEAALAGGGE